MPDENPWLDALLHAASENTSDPAALIGALNADLLDTLSQPGDMSVLLTLIAHDIQTVLSAAEHADPNNMVDALTSAQIDLKALIKALNRDEGSSAPPALD